jgi:hypothetical protein
MLKKLLLAAVMVTTLAGAAVVADLDKPVEVNPECSPCPDPPAPPCPPCAV